MEGGVILWASLTVGLLICWLTIVGGVYRVLCTITELASRNGKFKKSAVPIKEKCLFPNTPLQLDPSVSPGGCYENNVGL